MWKDVHKRHRFQPAALPWRVYKASYATDSNRNGGRGILLACLYFVGRGIAGVAHFVTLQDKMLGGLWHTAQRIQLLVEANVMMFAWSCES